MRDSTERADAVSDGATLTITEVSSRTGVSSYTLRYYEKAGLLDGIHRSNGGQRRRYAAADLDWLAFLLRLRDTGMSVANMLRFAELRRAGSSTVAARLALLSGHRAEVESRIRSLRTNARALDQKIEFYDALLQSQSETET